MIKKEEIPFKIEDFFEKAFFKGKKPSGDQIVMTKCFKKMKVPDEIKDAYVLMESIRLLRNESYYTNTTLGNVMIHGGLKLEIEKYFGQLKKLKC